MDRQGDGRIEVVLADEAGVAELLQPGDAMLVEAGMAVPHGLASDATVLAFDPPSRFHGAGCLCCAARNGASEALSALFQAGIRGRAPLRRVVALVSGEEGRQAVAAALADDLFVRARFRAAVPA